MGEVFYDFGLVSDKFSWFAGRYQLPVTPRKQALLVSGWLKVSVNTDLLPDGVFLQDLQDTRLLTALKAVLHRNVECRQAPNRPLPSMLWEKSTNERYPGMFEFWYFIEVDKDYLRMIPRFVPLSAVPSPSPEGMLLPIPFGGSVADSFHWFDYPQDLVGMLVCGATRSGKSVFVKQILTYLSTRFSPDYFTGYLADFKFGVEFGSYTSPHFSLFEDVESFLAAVQAENSGRWGLIRAAGCRNVIEYNSRPGSAGGRLPFSLVVIDEFAMFKLKGPKGSIDLASALVAQTAGAGLYWLISTQRPSVDIVTGSLKANLGARVSFSQPTKIDYDVVFGEGAMGEHAGPLGCPGRAWAMVGDRFFEFQSPFSG